MTSHLGTDPASGTRTPFVGFFLGWFVYFGVSFWFAVVFESLSTVGALSLASVNTGPPLLTSFVVLLNRRRLFHTEWTAARTVVVHAGTAVLFGVVNAGLLLLTLPLTGQGLYELADASPWEQFAGIALSSVFLYIVFAGILSWSESLGRIRESERRVAQEAVLRAEAEARAVRAQFNPHFVFNTLHSLMLLVRADPDAAERAIEDVATLIRYASIVQRRDIDAVPLTKELEVARRYVALESLRLHDRLAVTWDVEIDPSAVTVPAFALQTLVENAIKHGIEPLRDGGTVAVSVRAVDGMVRLTVADDGAGAEPAQVAAVPGHALGLLRQRLQLRYGDRADLSWVTAREAGFTITAEFPVESPDARPELDVIEARPSAPAGAAP